MMLCAGENVAFIGIHFSHANGEDEEIEARMQTGEVSFMSSWRMLTRDKGWVKPLLVLTLVGWIPILGQIAVLGYGFEWARLTAWGVDSAPKQRGVDYGKVISTGARAFLITISLAFVCGLVLQVLFPGSLAALMAMTAGGSGLASSAILASGATFFLLDLVIIVFAGTFLQAASLRGVLYDSFSGGWRLDRLLQMVVRDFGGFCKVLLVNLIGAAVSSAYAFVVAMIAALVLMGGLLSATAVIGLSDGYMTGWHFLADQLLHMGAGPVLLFILLLIAMLFVGNVIATAMNLVGVNAMGQWFARFDVGRWGVSSAPLPDDVPHCGARSASAAAPVDPTASSAPDPGSMASAPVDTADRAVPVERAEATAPSHVDGAVSTHESGFTNDGGPEATRSEAVGEAQVDFAPVIEKDPIPLGPISTEGVPDDRDDGPIVE